MAAVELEEPTADSVAVPADTEATLSFVTRWVTLNTPIPLTSNTSYLLATTFLASGDRVNVAGPANITIADGISLSGSGYTRSLG